MKFGITQSFSCSYLPERDEQLLVFVGDDDACAFHYPQLIQAGFRRSGNQMYRPYCQACSACQSLRVPVNEFKPSRSQRRILNKNKHLQVRVAYKPDARYYPLYERYINERHADGSMYPPSQSQFDGFLACAWSQPLFIEAYDNDKLIGVAVTDEVDSVLGHGGYSAMYTFFDPDYEKQSLGAWMILSQIKVTAQQGKTYLYLGYQIDDCRKMNYKNKYFPHERYADHQWHRINCADEIDTFQQTISQSNDTSVR